jgi:purine-binding chemotaxis protein CheW
LKSQLKGGLSMKTATQQLVAFTLGGQRYALRLESVERIVRMVEVIVLPKTPEIVMGVINFEGRPIPVLDIRTRFSLPPSNPNWNDYLIIARTSTRTVSFPVDSVIGVLECSPHEITPSEAIVPGIKYVAGVTRLNDGMVFIHDLDHFLSFEEEATLDGALTQAG